MKGGLTRCAPQLARVDLPVIEVDPRGLRIPGYRHLLCTVDVLVHSHGAARTLYEGRRSSCHSRDAIESTHDPEKRCAECPLLERCTGQVRAEVIFDGVPYRLLLTKVSARNFLLYLGTQRVPRGARIRVLNRGSWGEARFEDFDARRGSRQP